MTWTLGTAAGLYTFGRLAPRGRLMAVSVAGAVALIPIACPLAVAVLAACGVVRLGGRLRRRRLDGAQAEADVALLADLTSLGLRAGLGLMQALELAGQGVASQLGEEVHSVVRDARHRGAAAALATAGGRAARLYRLAARAAATGAPLAEAVDAYAAERRHADHAREVEQARRLPVRMLLPLALLILPGFVALAVGPALLEALERLQLAP